MSDGVNFQDYITRERERLTGQREHAQHEMAQWQYRIDMIDREFAAIEAYEAAKTGKQKQLQPANTGTARRARRGSRREAIVNAVRAAPAGLSRGELIELLGLKGDKAGEMSVSNALTALTKSKQLVREGGKYHAAAPGYSYEGAHGALQEAAE